MSQASAERSWNVALRAQGADALELAVYDVIGQDFWTGEGITSKDVLAKLREAPKAKKIDLRVNSVGGLVDEAKAMVNLLAERASAGVEIVGWVDGLAASSAAYLLTAAKRVVMPANAFQMIHGVRGGVRGTVEDIEAGAALMHRTNDQLAEAFAAASARRGKGKTKGDFLAAFAKGDLYLDADEAIAWGLADEKLEAVKLAACLADLSSFEDVHPALLNAPFVTLNGVAPTRAPAPQPITPPGPVVPAVKPNNGQEKNTMSKAVLNLVAIATCLGFTAEAAEQADEETVIKSINKLKTSAAIGTEIEQLLGQSGRAAVGAVKALKDAQEAHVALQADVANLKIVNARRDFETIRDQGLKDRKLVPATAKYETERFDAVLKDEKLSADLRAAKAVEIAEELKGRLAVAPRVVASGAFPPPVSGGGESGPVLHNGKAFEAMNGSERKRLKDENPELYNTMREDAVARGAV
jgi:ATP-dependent protease ClpP protease subunit